MQLAMADLYRLLVASDVQEVCSAALISAELALHVFTPLMQRVPLSPSVTRLQQCVGGLRPKQEF